MYYPPQCEVVSIITGAYLQVVSNTIEKADPTEYGDDFWTIGG
jgi:hypothetical protein